MNKRKIKENVKGSKLVFGTQENLKFYYTSIDGHT